MAYLKPDDDRLLFVPLGGSGEIGMNLNLYGTRGKWIMVDCGMSFPDEDMPGIERVFPDPAFIVDEGDDLLALLVTHGHEDHIGAIPYLWSEFQCPVYATPFTAELIRDKLAEAGLLNDVPLYVVQAADEIELGAFKIRYIPLAHSIAEGHGLAIETPNRRVFHTGDWKLDNRPLIGPVSPGPLLQELGEAGVDCVVGDSTNIFNKTESGSEHQVRENLLEIVRGLTGRVVITTFASNVARLETAAMIARETGRDLVLLGRSMHRILKAAQATGYLQDFPSIVPEEHVDDLPRDRCLILCTGCQGEPRAALSRIAAGTHKTASLSKDDTVLFSSKIIPGNEITLGRLFNDLTLLGVQVITEKDAFIHVSGHPGREELATMYGWLKPRSVLPVHGEHRHLERHAAFAKSLQIPSSLAPSNGDIIEIGEKGLARMDRAPAGRLVMDGDLIVEDEDEALLARRRLMHQGLVTLALVLDDDAALMCEPQARVSGVPGNEDGELEDAILDAVERSLDRMKPTAREADSLVEETVRIATRRTCRRLVGKNPSVMTHIVRPNG